MGATVADPAHFDEDLKRVCALFPLLDRRMRQRGGTLSGGEQQMLAIARALMSRPRLLLLDEPSLGLAPMLAQQIFRAIRELNTRDRLTVFLVEQNAFHALKLAHRGYVIVNGEITLSGSGRELLERPEVRAAYLEGGRARRPALKQAAPSPLASEKAGGIHDARIISRAWLWSALRCCLRRSAGASAQTGPIRFIVGCAGRRRRPLRADHRRAHGQDARPTIIVENRPGATGNISAQFMSTRRPTGN